MLGLGAGASLNLPNQVRPRGGVVCQGQVFAVAQIHAGNLETGQSGGKFTAPSHRDNGRLAGGPGAVSQRQYCVERKGIGLAVTGVAALEPGLDLVGIDPSTRPDGAAASTWGFLGRGPGVGAVSRRDKVTEGRCFPGRRYFHGGGCVGIGRGLDVGLRKEVQ